MCAASSRVQGTVTSFPGFSSASRGEGRFVGIGLGLVDEVVERDSKHAGDAVERYSAWNVASPSLKARIAAGVTPTNAASLSW